MIGDNDILFNNNKLLLNASELIKTHNFKLHEEHSVTLHYYMKHYPPMVNSYFPAAIEIHLEILNSQNEEYSGLKTF